MTVLSKINTLIEYAKYGVSMSHVHNGDREYELYLPKSLNQYNRTTRDPTDPINFATEIKGKIKVFGSSSDSYTMFKTPNNICRIIDLPECILTPGEFGIFSGLRVLKIFRMPKIKNLKRFFLSGCFDLEFVELGTLDTTDSTSFNGCSKIKEIIVGKGTRASLSLYHCPNLTQESLHNIIDNYADMTGTRAPTFYVGEENLSKISPEYLKKLRDKNINYQ